MVRLIPKRGHHDLNGREDTSKMGRDTPDFPSIDLVLHYLLKRMQRTSYMYYDQIMIINDQNNAWHKSTHCVCVIITHIIIIR